MTHCQWTQENVLLIQPQETVVVQTISLVTLTTGIVVLKIDIIVRTLEIITTA